jgi:hypothetical protein
VSPRPSSLVDLKLESAGQKPRNRDLTRRRDPRFIREFKEKYCVEAMVEHVTQKKK